MTVYDGVNKSVGSAYRIQLDKESQSGKAHRGPWADQRRPQAGHRGPQADHCGPRADHRGQVEDKMSESSLHEGVRILSKSD